MADTANAWQAVGWWGPLILLAAALASAGLIVLLGPLLRRFALAIPTARSSHRQSIPQGGGIAVIAATFGASALAVVASPPLAASMTGLLPPVLAAALLLTIVGAIDDTRSLGVAARLLAQALAVAMIIGALPADIRVFPVAPLWLERALLCVGGLWFVNLVNFMDGIDWMMVAEVVPITAGVALIGALGALPPEGLVVALALNGAMLGFAPFNRPVARLFLGDSGSLPAGLVVGWLLVIVAANGHLAAALLLPLYFIADATITLLRRLRAGDQVWQAHRSHFYQRARDGGFSTLEIVTRVFAVNVGLVALAALTVVLPTAAAGLAGVAVGAALVAWLLASFAAGRPYGAP